jgi:ADP-ribose pyrophosphatase
MKGNQGLQEADDISSQKRETETSSSQQEIESLHLVLPYEDGSHGSAKIIISNDCHLYSSDSSSSSSSQNNILSVSDFRDRLQVTIHVLKQLHKTALWIEVPMDHARYIEACTGIEGLCIHHASGDKVHLSLWLKEDVENKIPEYATHQIGVGAIVINSRNEILCVREMRKNFRKWKIPGGLADLGEDLEDAAIREVKEETGIKCRFKSVLGFRHTHGMQFGRSDMYFVCMMEPEEGKDGIPTPVAQDGEIALAAWVPLQEYMDMVHGVDGETAGPHPMMQKMMELIHVSGIQRTVVSSIVPGRKPSPIYHAPTNTL